MATEEVWKPIPGHKWYEASNLGRIRSIDRVVFYKSGRRGGMPTIYRGRILRQFKSTNGRLVTCLGGPPHKYVSRLVALAFLGRIPDGHHVCHNNDNPYDNRLSNLRIDTPTGNAADAQRNGRIRSKLTHEHIKEIREAELLRRSLSHRALAKKYGVHEATIGQIARGVMWKALK